MPALVLALVPALVLAELSGPRPYLVTPHASSTWPERLTSSAAYLMMVTGLRIHASWVMCSIVCWSMIPIEFQLNIA